MGGGGFNPCVSLKPRPTRITSLMVHISGLEVLESFFKKLIISGKVHGHSLDFSKIKFLKDL